MEIDKKLGFIKLFKLNIPDINEFEYYIDILSKTKKWSNIKEYWRDWLEYIGGLGTESNPNKLHIENANILIKYLLQTESFKKINSDDIPHFPTNKSFSPKPGNLYLSIDCRSGNWRSMKEYDSQNEMGDSPEDLIVNKCGLNPIFSKSKYFRQFVFGNLNPKRFVKIQRFLIEKEVLSLTNITPLSILHDEVIFDSGDFNEGEIWEFLYRIVIDRWRVNFYRVREIDGVLVKDYINFSTGEVTGSELYSVPSNQFYWRTKELILDQKLDIRDLVFRNEDMIGIWRHPKIKFEIVSDLE
jgi:hypothetical protein